MPRRLGTLGLDAHDLGRHIAWDLGAGALAEAVGRRLAVPVVLGGYSRLVIDCNRRLDDPTSIAECSDGTRIPGNRGLDATSREMRMREIFVPYHAALAAALSDVERDSTTIAGRAPAPAGSACVLSTRIPALIAIHSFTAVFGGLERPWHCGVLWDTDARLAVPLLAALRAEPGLVVGDNQPYSGRHPADYTVDTHGEQRGRAHVCIEVRQDLLATALGINAWAERLARVLESLLLDPAIYRPLREQAS